MLKLFYNDKPESNLLEVKDYHMVWQRTPTKPNPSSFYKVLNELGIDFDWSDNPDSSVIVADLGSAGMLDDETCNNMFKTLSERYKKVLIFSGQEPWNANIVRDYVLKYPNLYFMDTTTFNINQDKNYFPFPSLFCQMSSNDMCTTLNYHNGINYENAGYKFNCLMNIWRPEKHFLRWALNFVGIDQQGIITYRNPGEKYSDIECHLNKSSAPQTYKNLLLKQSTVPQKLELKDYNIDEVELSTNKRRFDVNFRAWPEEVFTASAFSLICESSSNFENQDRYVSEKFIYPVMNEHPVLTMGDQYYNVMIKKLGFELHDEIFNYGFDTIESMPDRALALAEQVQNLDINEITSKTTDVNSETRKKLRHNKYLIFNKGSILWTKMRLRMVQYLEELQY